MQIQELKDIGAQVRRDIIRQVHSSPSGHPSGINIHTIKPFDEQAILQSVDKTRCAVTAEEHQLNGGLGDAVCQVLSRNRPSPVEMVGVNNSFGESGTPAQLMEKYGLNAQSIVNAVRKAISRK